MLSIYSFSFDILEKVALTGNGAEIFLASMFVLGGIPGSCWWTGSAANRCWSGRLRLSQ
ncbi:hypothetical protein ACTXLS_10280 [Corynebacterium variabile]|uniref:hypothetical protein n=1 Tax=Corynebacterium variabile TaxID=1727 RepID=UPI003FD2BE7B